MAEKKLRKVVTAKIGIKPFNDQIIEIDSLPESERDENLVAAVKNKFGVETGDIVVTMNQKNVIIKWYPPKTARQAEQFHNQAIAYAKKKDFEKAIESWMNAISINSQDPDYHYFLGVANFELKNYDEASRYLQQTLKLCPLYHRASLMLGLILYKKRKFDVAKKFIQRSLLFNPNNGYTYLALGNIYSILRNYKKGIAMYEHTIKLMPEDPRPYMGLAKIYSLEGNIQKANEYFRRVIALDGNGKGALAKYARRAVVTEMPAEKEAVSSIIVDSDKNLEELYSVGYAHYIAGDHIRAEAFYKKYLSMKADDDFVWFALGETQMRSGKCDQAVASFKKAIDIDAKGLYYKELAIAFDLIESPADVRAAIEKALNLGKKDHIIYALGGKNLLAEGKQTEAIEMLDEAVKLNKNNFLARYYLAVALSRNGEIERAIEQLEEIKATKVNTPLKEKADVLLDKLLGSGID
ncbi:tetratricopeptide repeat protein [candidate division KSB1 bacterium]|nr:tetratricopeptide repeat protein [candidate division KSB1 bacterium]